MKRKNNKLLTLMLAGMLCTATVGAVAATSSVDASAATSAKTYALSTVFETSASSTSKVKGNEDGKTDIPHDYIVKKVARGLNTVSIAISKVTVR